MTQLSDQISDTDTPAGCGVFGFTKTQTVSLLQPEIATGLVVHQARIFHRDLYVARSFKGRVSRILLHLFTDASVVDVVEEEGLFNSTLPYRRSK